MKIFTRSMHPVLYGKMQRLFRPDHEFHCCTTFQTGYGAVEYLFHLLSYDGFIVNCDEDCFIRREDAIQEIIDHMRTHGYAYCGVPDGGVVSHRFNSWANMNPFFNVFNLDVIKPILAQTSRAEIEQFYQIDAQKAPPSLPYAWSHTRSEPYAGLFYWLNYTFTPLYLTVREHSDTITTVVEDLHGQPFAYHSWWSRKYGGRHRSSREHTARIDALYAEVAEMSLQQ